ncbi:MAG TPA: type II toxin-antitoxin system RelE/ParE family toxin [Pirellulales bacterium]|nr:type II toxin-antitoxin system RelE/ParE family toxin [Pirellulales bacterium]
MEFKIVWTAPALEQLRDACTYISQANPSAAESVGDEIIRHVEVLAKFPFIGPVYSRGGGGRVREILCGSYRVFYEITEQQRVVEILSVWHAARGSPPLEE